MSKLGELYEEIRKKHNWDEADEYYAEKESEMEQQIMKEKLVIPSMSKTYKDLKKGEKNE